MTASIRRYLEGPPTTGDVISGVLPSPLEGDHVYTFVIAYATFADTTAPADPFDDVPDWNLINQVEITESATVVGRFGLFARVAVTGMAAPTFNHPCNASNKIGWATSFSVKDAGELPGADVAMFGPLQVADVSTPPVPIRRDAMIVALGMLSAGRFLPAPTVDDPYSISRGVSSTSLLHGASSMLFQTAAVSADIPSVATNTPTPTLLTGGIGWYCIIGIPLFPISTEVSLPALPEPKRLQLGCADDYRAYITDSDYETVIAGVGWSDLEWNRCLDEISTASVTVPDALGGLSCIAPLGGLLPWRYGLMLERNDQEVWKGVITSLQRSANVFRVSASDILCRFQKRLATRQESISFVNADAGTAFALTILNAQIDGENWSLQPPEPVTFMPFTRTISVTDLEIAWDIIEDMLDSSVDAWVGAGVLYAWQPFTGWMYYDGFSTTRLDGPYDSSGELIYGTFTERNFTELPTWSINGQAQANTAWVPAPDVGEDGTRQLWVAAYGKSVVEDGVLDIVQQNDLYRPDEEETDLPSDVFQNFADSLVAQRAISPAVIEGGTLAANAPIDCDNLRPGSIWTIDIWDSGYGQLLQRSRLKRVTVTATKDQEGKVIEAVKPTLYPVGFEA